METAVEIRDLVKDFRPAGRKEPLRAVDHVSLTIAPGEVYGLIGPNGSGKSTTMKALLGLVQPDAGVCRIFGNDSLQVDSRQDVGFLPENPYFYMYLSSAETVGFYGKLCGLLGAGLRFVDRAPGGPGDFVALAELAVLIACFVVVGRWIYVANANAHSFGTGDSASS